MKNIPLKNGKKKKIYHWRENMIKLKKVMLSRCNTSHKFWDQSPSPHYQCCLQVSETVSWYKLRCFYSSNMLQHWVGGRGLVYFCKVSHSRISRNFSRNLLGLNNLCEVLSQNLRNLVNENEIGSYLVFQQFLKNTWDTSGILKLYHSTNWEEWEGPINVILCNTLCKY